MSVAKRLIERAGNRSRRHPAIEIGGKRTTPNSVEAAMTEVMRAMAADISAMASALSDGPDRYVAMYKGAAILRDAMQRMAPRARKPVHRYKNGKIVATYMPGNLQRSIKVLTHMKDKRNVYVGVERQPAGSGGGVFTGSKTDGWYAHFVEYGPRKKPFIRPAVAVAGEDALKEIRNYVQLILRASGGGN